MSKDKDLENLLKPLKDLKPNDLQMQKWQRAVQAELPANTNIKTSIFTMKWALQLAAASLIGFIVGALIFKNQPDQGSAPRIAQISLDDATFEYTHDNLD